MNKRLRLAAVLALGCSASSALAAETVPEKAKVVKNDVVRAARKTGNRIDEAVCLKSDAACLAKKAEHRTTEAVDAVKDKASEVKNKVD